MFFDHHIHMTYLSLYFADTAKHTHVMLQSFALWEDFLSASPVYRNLALSQYLIHPMTHKKSQ